MTFNNAKKMNRKIFLLKTAIGAGSLLAMPSVGLAQIISEPGETLPAEKVKEFVKAGHTDLEKTKQMLVEIPNLLYAA